MNDGYRLYAKFAGQKRFKPIYYSKGSQVGNLIYATIFTEESKNTRSKKLSITLTTLQLSSAGKW